MHLLPTQDEVVAILRESRRSARWPLRISRRHALERIPAGAARDAELPECAYAERGPQPAASLELRKSAPSSLNFRSWRRPRAACLSRMASAKRCAPNRSTGPSARTRIRPCASVSSLSRMRESRSFWSTISFAPGTSSPRCGHCWRPTERRSSGLPLLIYQPTPQTKEFGDLPLYYLAKLEASYYADAASCELCRKGVPLQQVWV